MITEQEVLGVLKLIEQNEKGSKDNLKYDFNGWHSDDGQRFLKRDNDNNLIEINNYGEVTNLRFVELLQEWSAQNNDYDERVGTLLERELQNGGMQCTDQVN
jgi:hypothetical protein